MNLDTQLKLQAFVDGELPERDAAEMQRLIDSDAGARALAAELRSLKSALASNEIEVNVPETREFYWSKISREIERIEAQAPVPPQPVHWSVWLKRLIAPVGVVAVLMVVLTQSPSNNGPVQQTAIVQPQAQVQSTHSQSGAVSFYLEQDDVTIVWIDTGANSGFTGAAADATLPPQ